MTRPHTHPETPASNLRHSLEGALRFILKHNAGADRQTARTRAIDVLDLVKKHVDGLGIEPSLTQPLTDIRMAFAEAERGIVDPLFEPEPLLGRPPTQLARLHVMMRASLAIDLFMKAGKPSEAAARQVVKGLQKQRIVVGGKDDVADWKKVRGWRQELTKAAKGKTQHTEDWVFYGGMYELLRNEILERVGTNELDPLAEAENQLNALKSGQPTFG